MSRAEAASVAVTATADAPLINVKCMTVRCPQYDVQQTVPSGTVVTDTVLSTYNLVCSICGHSLVVLSGT